MTRRFGALIVLVGVMVALTPLAYASPPDPSWIRGLYDGADFDDIVVLLTSGTGVVEPFPLADVDAHKIVIDCVAPADEGCSAAPTLGSNPARAPPVF